MNIKFFNQMLICTFVLSVALFAGCGGGSDEVARQDVLDIPVEVHFGGGVKQILYDFRATFRTSGVAGAKRESEILVENLGDFEGQPLGEHGDTYQQISDGVKALHTLLGGSPSKDEVGKKIEELVALAESLPGEADEKGVATN